MLDIIKASAGSGKTYKLTEEYLNILLGSRSFSPTAFKHVLAVTFTNKATDEMKQRILEKLYALSISLPATIKSRNAKDLLIELLNDYSAFNVSTIDKFFQNTLRSFARELGQYPSYNVELDHDAVLQQAIDLMMDSLSYDDKLLEWVIMLYIENIREGGNWNASSKLKKLASELFSEEYKKKSDGGKELKDRDTIEKYREILNKIICDFETPLRDLAKEGLSIISNAGVNLTDFSGGSRSVIKKVLTSLSNGDYSPPSNSFSDFVDNLDKWAPKTSLKGVKEKMAIIFPLLNPILSQIAISYKKSDSYFTSKVIIGNLYTYGILSDIHSNILGYCRKKNIMLLSESTELLNRIIGSSDTPFIYEKIGTKIDHFMLDEFQDTSGLQWDNFRPLIKESLDNGNKNLVVGDVKQSIYRWRSSDWNLLNEQINKDIGQTNINALNLVHNWRSEWNLINFNNGFFTSAADYIQNKINGDYSSNPYSTLITEIYSSVCQKLPDGKPDGKGRVELNFIDKEGETKWKERVLEEIPLRLESLKKGGCKFNDIALLVRSNSDGALLANDLIQKGYGVISEDSLFISSSLSVNKLVAMLESIINPEEPINKYLLRGVNSVSVEGESLYQICEKLIRYLGEEALKETIFIQAFLDLVSAFISSNGSDLGGFIKWWDETGRKKTISAPEGEDAIRILTIHKAKGLQFKVAIIPFLSMKFGYDSSKYLWCKVDKAPFNDMGLIPVPLNSLLNRTLFSEEFIKEAVYSYVDALNIAYVAFTRPEQELIIFAKKPKIKNDGTYTISSIGDILYNQFEASLSSDNSYVIGERASFIDDKLKSEKGSESGVKLIKIDGNFLSIDIGERLKISYSGRDFFNDENPRRKGVVMHGILSEVNTLEDLKKAVRNGVAKGVIPESDFNDTYTFLKEVILSVKERNWFNSSLYTHLNERPIISPPNEEYRPDRVMINERETIVVDYKFGSEQRSSYSKQVKNYMTLLEEMGYPNVSGFVWYISENKVESV